MQLTIKHTTKYDYAEPLLYSIQQLKLTPQDGFGQKVKSWSIQMNGQPHQHIDTYGNVVHTLVVDKNLSEIKKIYALLTYRRYEEAPEIAILAKKYNKEIDIHKDNPTVLYQS